MKLAQQKQQSIISNKNTFAHQQASLRSELGPNGSCTKKCKPPPPFEMMSISDGMTF